jgi:hypothetical protein
LAPMVITCTIRSSISISIAFLFVCPISLREDPLIIISQTAYDARLSPDLDSTRFHPLNSTAQSPKAHAHAHRSLSNSLIFQNITTVIPTPSPRYRESCRHPAPPRSSRPSYPRRRSSLPSSYSDCSHESTYWMHRGQSHTTRPPTDKGQHVSHSPLPRSKRKQRGAKGTR